MPDDDLDHRVGAVLVEHYPSTPAGEAQLDRPEPRVGGAAERLSAMLTRVGGRHAFQLHPAERTGAFSV